MTDVKNIFLFFYNLLFDFKMKKGMKSFAYSYCVMWPTWFNIVCNAGGDGTPRAPMGEDRATYRREGGPGGADKRGEAGAGATQSFQFVRKRLCC